jgi:hypothetical protein
MQMDTNDFGYDHEKAASLAASLYQCFLDHQVEDPGAAFMGVVVFARSVVRQLESLAERHERVEIRNNTREEFCRLMMKPDSTLPYKRSDYA